MTTTEEQDRIDRIRKEIFPDGFYRLDFTNQYNVALGYQNPGKNAITVPGELVKIPIHLNRNKSLFL